MRKILICTILCCCAMRMSAQNFALKTNALYWLTTTMNVEAEAALSKKWTVDLSVAYNPWNFGDGKKMHLLLLQPEAKYWLCEKFEGHFVGAHLHGGQYFGGFSDKRYDGYLAGGGLTYGYDWILSPHWNLEAAIGLGHARPWAKESDPIPRLQCYERQHKEYRGGPQPSVSFIHII